MRLGHKIELTPTQPYLRRVIFSRAYHDEDVLFLDRIIPTDAVILDIGANIGLLSCAYASYLKKKNPQIFAVEAIQKNYQQLVRNLRLNEMKNVTPFRLALGESNGELRFRLPTADFVGNAVGTNVLSASDDAQSKRENTYEEVVPMKTLDEWTRDCGIDRCDFIKIDIEGAELSAFRGGRSFLAKTRPIILSEFNYYWIKEQGLGIEDFVSFFKELEYDCFMDTGDRFERLELENFRPRLVDLLFVPRERTTSSSL